MKNIFLVGLLVMSFRAFAQTDSSATSGKSCEDQKNALENSASKPTQGYNGRYAGTTNLMNCDSLARGKFSKLYTNGTRDPHFKWGPYIEYSCIDNCKNPTEQQKCRKKATEDAQSCESIAYVLSRFDRDWTDQEQITPVEATTAARAPQQQQANSATAAAAAANSNYKCTSKGIETLDYAGCKKFSEQLEVIEAVQQVGYATQEVVYKDKIAGASIKHSSDENTATGALKATAESLEMQKNMYQQRTAVDATKLAYLYSIYNEIPRSSQIAEKCGGISQKVSADPTIVQNEIEGACKTAVRAGIGGFALAQNQHMLDAMRTKLISIATSIGSNALLANLLGKRADDANDAIAKIDAFKPTDPATVTEEEAKTTFCAQNPGLSQCLTSDLDTAFGAISDNVITFGEGGTGTSYGPKSAIGDGVSTGNEEASTDRTPITAMGTPITDAYQDNSIEGSKAATVTSTGNGGAAPGGGGGGASAGSGSSGAVPGSQGGGGGTSAAALGKAPKYEGGAGSIAVMGGFGINKAKGDGKSDDNPFGKLFGKDAKGGSGVVNFRDIASQKVGDKKDNLFEMISKRYTNVSADKRLLEYELAK